MPQEHGLTKDRALAHGDLYGELLLGSATAARTLQTEFSAKAALSKHKMPTQRLRKRLDAINV
jgi:hypothetical protein